MNDIKQKAECNNLLGKEDNLALYTVLYYALSSNKSLTIKEILSRIDKKFHIEITPNKANYILKLFVDKDIVRKSVKNGTHKYYLHQKIYFPSQNTPIPVYQVGLLVFAFILMVINFFFSNNITAKWMSLTFFGSLLLVLITHQFMFDYRR